MSIQDKELLAWLLMLLMSMVMGFFLRHIWSFAVFVIHNAFAFGVLPFLAVSKLAAGIAGIHFLC